MGWISYRATEYKANGDIDRKKEVEKGFDLNCCEVVKGIMIGSTYYGAIRKLTEIVNGETVRLPEDKQYIFGVVALTTVNKREYYNIAYKHMSEDEGPTYSYDCPESILNLLTETDNEYALRWREKCRKKLEEKKIKQASQKKLKDLPDGTAIEFVSNANYGNGSVRKGDTVTLRKRTLYSNGKLVSRWWFNRYSYWQNKNLPTTFTVVKM